MGSLSRIVNVAVSTLTAAVKEEGFGLPMVADYHTRWLDRVRLYASQTEMITDGFTANDAAYIAVGDAFAQNPQLPLVAVGRRRFAPDLEVRLVPVAQHSTVYTVGLRGPTGLAANVSITSDATSTVAEITLALTNAINTAALGIVATDQTTHVRLKAASVGLWFGASPADLALITTQQVHADPGIATDLAELAIANSDWYGVTLTTAGAAELAAMATWVESNKKISLQQTQDGDCIGSGAGDVGTTLKTANQFRTALIFHPDGRRFAGAAWFGATFPNDPGGITFKFRRLAGIPTVALTSTQLTNLEGKNVNWFTSFGGVAITGEGKTAAGEFIDIIRDRDWFESRLQTREYTLLINAKKVPMTDAGLAAIEGELRAQLDEAISAGFLSPTPAPVIVMPLASQISTANRALRKAAPITFSAKIAGAVHAIDLAGTITV